MASVTARLGGWCEISGGEEEEEEEKEDWNMVQEEEWLLMRVGSRGNTKGEMGKRKKKKFVMGWISKRGRRREMDFNQWPDGMIVLR